MNKYKEEFEMKTGQAARYIGVSDETLRNYEKRGLIRSRRTPGNIRLFKIQDVVRLRRQQSNETRI